jgi:hypothetical protein
MATVPTSTRQRIDISNPIITRIQVEGNDVVSFLNGTNYIRGMSQIMPQMPTYISYRYDTITISQVAGDSFTFTVYTVTDVGGNTFTPLTFQDPADVVQAKTVEIYRLLVTAVFKGCCECGNTEPECSIQYTAGTDPAIAGTLWDVGGVGMRINYFTANNQDFTGFWPIIQDGSWIFVFSKTDPTVYGVYQLSNYMDGGTFAQFDSTLLAGPAGFPDGTSLCVDVTSVGGSLVQGWQDTLDINSTLDKDNTVDGAGFDFVFDNNSSFTINSVGGSIQTSISGSSLLSGPLSVDVTSSYIDIITPGYGAATTGMVLALDASGHVEYTLAGTGTISSIGLFMPSAFTVSTPNPLTSNGDFTVTGAGTDLEYINGLGELATLPVYTVENGLHPFGGVPGETPPNPFLFHLGGQLIEDTLIETTEVVSPGVVNEWQLSVRGAGGTDGQNTQFPFGVANLGDGGVATFQDYGSGDRPNPSVEIVGDVDLLQPLLELNMAGSLPTADDTLLRLRYTGDPSLAMMTMDYQFRNNNAVVANSNFVGSRLSTEVVSFVDGDEQTRFELQLVDNGTLSNKLELQGFGQLVLNEYATSAFSNGVSNIDNDLEYVLAVDSSGNVYKKISEGGGTVTEVDATGLLTTSPDPITTTGTVTSEMNSGFLVGRYDAGVGVFQEITIGSGLTLTGDTLSADGGGGTYTVANGLHYQEDPFDPNVFHLGGNLIENTTIYNQGFDFTVERANNGTALTVNNLSTGVGTSQTAIQAFSNDGLAGDFYAGQDFYAIDEIEPIIKINRTTILPPDGEFNYNEIGSSIDFINPTVVGSLAIQVPYSSRIASRWTTSLNEGGFTPSYPIGRTEIWNYDGLSLQSLTATFNSGANFNGGKRSRGLVQFNQYGQGNFYGLLAPVYGLGVDDQGNILEVDLGGGGTYNGDQGVYKDTSLTPETFMLGAPSGSQGGIAFSIDRFISVQDKSLQMEGTSSVLRLVEGSASLPPRPATLTATAQNNYYAGYFTSNTGEAVRIVTSANSNALFVESQLATNTVYTAAFVNDFGGGIDVKSKTSSRFFLFNGTPSSVSNIIDFQNIPSAGPYTVGQGVSVSFMPGADLLNNPITNGVVLSSVFSDVTGGASRVDFDVNTFNNGAPLNHTTFIGDGQLRLHEYGQTPANFPDASPVWALGVDASGNVVEFTPGGGGTTYTVDNGLTEDPANNFQLGGALVKNTIVNGAANAYDLTFDELNEFYVNGNNKMQITSTNATGDFSQCYVAPPAAQLINNTAGFAASTISAEAGVASMEATPIKILLNATEMQLRTPAVVALTAVNGQVLTLIDAATGEAEWQTGGGGIPFGEASSTIAFPDDYTATIGTATTYTDGDAYIVRFLTGNTSEATLNINSIGVRTLYRNNDGALIGGDIWDGGEMLVVYNATINGFDCIGTSPNSLFAYVTNDQGSTITRGQAVFAFGGTGNRITVKLAQGDSDANSAQTLGFVFSTSIAANQKGIIIIQGYFTGLSLFPPSAGWVNGDTVYLSPTVPGGVTRIKPLAPDHLVYLGVVASTSPGTAGRMYVRVQNGYEMNELHDVASTGAVNNDILYRDTTVTPNLWKPASISTILGYTPERPIEKIVLSGGDITTTSNTAQNITGLLTSSLDANSSYLVLGRARIGCNNTGGVKFASTIPSGTSISLTFAGINNTATTAALATVVAGGGSLSGQSINNANTTSTCMIHGMIVTGATAGAVQLQFASTTSGQTSTIYGGSLTSIILIKMA